MAGRRRFFLALAVACLLTSSLAQEIPLPDKYVAPLGIGFEELTYPYPTAYLNLLVEGQEVRMSFMDVPASKNANGRTVLLLHGKNFWGAYWADTIRHFSDQGFRVIVPDQLGFGKSSKPNIHYSFDLLAENTAGLLDLLQVPKAIVIGHSMGGMLAIRFARLFPGRTEALVLEDPIGLEDYRLTVPPAPLEQLYQREMNTSLQDYRSYIQSYFVNFPKDQAEIFVEPRMRVALSSEFPRWAMSAALTSLMIYEQPVCYELGEVKVPTLLIIGAEDHTAVGRDRAPIDLQRTLGNIPELARKAVAAIPGARLVELPNVGHIPHLEAPDKFLQAVDDFLRR
ncbi:MAG: alpha/beta hydrolase [Verrucomicrobia bacterium]|nr:alpha/beta hydrolase [Verrucomicrobiota bacterium]